MTENTTPPADDGSILANDGPWGSGQNGGRQGGNNPWGQNNGNRGPRGGGNRPPNDDLDAMLRDAQQKFRNRFGGRGPSGEIPPEKFLFFALAAAVLLWLATGFYRVEPGENAVILTFGEWTSTRGEAGLGYHAPWPIQSIIKEDVSFERRIQVGFRDQGGRDGRGAVAAESMMLTGDENIIDINFIVLWRISDAGNYLFKIRDPQTTVKKVAESAMRETIGRTQIQRALTEARVEIEIETKQLMQKILDEYEAGVVINSVQLLRVDPPESVVDAFNDVQRARTDLERMRNEAETYRNDIVPRARGEAQRLMQDAEAYKAATITRAEGDAARFTSIYQAYAQSKDVTQRRMYLETLQSIMKDTRKIIVGDDRGVPVLPYMQLEQPKAARTQK